MAYEYLSNSNRYVPFVKAVLKIQLPFQKLQFELKISVGKNILGYMPLRTPKCQR